MLIRKCTMEDLEAVAEMYDWAVLRLLQTENYPKWEYGVYPSGQSVKKAIAQGVQYLCAEDGAVLGGFILNEDPQGSYEKGAWTRALARGEYLVIHTLATEPSCQGKGVGKAMVEFCVRKAENEGYRALRIDVVPENLPARKLYEAMGFAFAGEVDLDRNIPEIPSFALYERNLQNRSGGASETE